MNKSSDVTQHKISFNCKVCRTIVSNLSYYLFFFEVWIIGSGILYRGPKLYRRGLVSACGVAIFTSHWPIAALPRLGRFYEKVANRFASQQFPQDQNVCNVVTLNCWHKRYESAQEVIRDTSPSKAS